jgi:hypothetical protein
MFKGDDELHGLPATYGSKSFHKASSNDDVFAQKFGLE